MLHDMLRETDWPQSFQLPIDPRVTASGFNLGALRLLPFPSCLLLPLSFLSLFSPSSLFLLSYLSPYIGPFSREVPRSWLQDGPTLFSL